MTPDDNLGEMQGQGQGPDTLRIMLLGKSGAGKSSSGNSILGREVFKSELKLARVTRICQKEEGNINDTPVAIIDTPGLFETIGNQKDIEREILKCVKLQEPGVHVFVVVVPLGRMTQEDKETNTLIETMFGPSVWNHSIVLFTHGDRLKGKTINDVISESDANLRNFIRKCSGGFHVFNNKNPEDNEQVAGFLTKIQTLVALNGTDYYCTNMFPPKERRIRERQESILAERTDEIGRKEKQLQNTYKGEDLKQRMKVLWRKEEDIARAEAERSTRPTVFMCVVMFVLAAILFGSYASGRPEGLVVMGILGVVFGLCFRLDLFKESLLKKKG